jgi:hypothetical protein
MAKKKDEFAPCRLVTHDDGSYSLTFSDFDSTAETFEEMDQDGGGYGWHGVIEALIRLRGLPLAKQLNFDPEASMFAVASKDRDALKQVAALIREAVGDPELLREAIENADPDLMD